MAVARRPCTHDGLRGRLRIGSRHHQTQCKINFWVTVQLMVLAGLNQTITFGYENHASRLVTFLDSPTPKRYRQWGPKRPAHSAIHSWWRCFIGIPPDQDFGSLPAEKQIDMVQLGYGNINGILGNIVGNTKVPALRHWIRTYNLNSFFGVEGNLNWKCMPPEGRLPEFF